MSEFTIKGSFTAYGRTVQQIQYCTPEFVVTKVDRGTFIYLPQHDERFLVESNQLTRIEAAVLAGQVEKMKAIVGVVGVHMDDEIVPVTVHCTFASGFLCRRYRFSSSAARVRIIGETLAAGVPELGLTALHLERAHDAKTQPFTLPLDPNWLVFRSEIRTISTQFDQRQSYQLDSLEDSIANLERLQEIALRRIGPKPLGTV